MSEYFGNKAFLKSQAKGFKQCVRITARKVEEEDFLKTVKIVPKTKVPTSADVINSHTLYKIKVNDDRSLKLKARIAPHGNEDGV